MKEMVVIKEATVWKTRLGWFYLLDGLLGYGCGSTDQGSSGAEDIEYQGR